jgi:predicted Zn-dependent peptidase
MINSKNKIFYIFAFVLTVFIFSSYASYSQTETHTDGKYTYQTVAGDPMKARIYKLSNGLTVYMTVYKDEPRIQTFIPVKVGSKFDPHQTTGLAHYLEHMMFKGTDKFGTSNYTEEKVYLDKIINLFEVYRNTTDTEKRKQIYHQIDSISGLASQYAIANEYDKMVSALGARGTNAWTSVEQTVYTNEIPSNQLEKWLTIEAERFRHPVMRLFHTELEAVYEEKNISLDNDDSKLWEALNSGLFQKHPYGTQTTIGTIENLKNPSLKTLIKYRETYYVPNKMAICLSGDFDPDEAIKIIDEKFSSLPSEPVPPFVPPAEDPITHPIVKDVYGPDAEQVDIGYRFNGISSKDADMINLISEILSNGNAGLMDLNLNQSQKVLGSYADADLMKDYSEFVLNGKPKQGQTLEEVKDLLLPQIEKLKKGEFPDWLPGAVINNMKLQQTKSLESNRRRGYAFVRSFTEDIPWDVMVNKINNLAKISKSEIVEFANKNFKDNYIIVYKHTGEDKNVKKIVKPEITPVKVNRGQQSQFMKDLLSTESPEIKPVFLDYKKDIAQQELKEGIQLYYKQNTEDSTFNLYYVLNMGTNNDKKLGIAISYLEYLGTSQYTPAQLKEEFYKLACSFSVSSSDDQVYVSLSGLDENFEKGLKLFEEFLSDMQPNKEALDNLVKDILKVRADEKLSQEKILWNAMYSYGEYGPVSPFTNILSEAELKALSPEELISILKSIPTYRHLVLYYGPEGIETVTDILNKDHKIPGNLQPVPAPVIFPQLAADETKVYVVNYPDMVQAEIIFLSKDDPYNKDLVPDISMFNSYYGGGMSGITFQELRESKALAYSVFSSYRIPVRKEECHYVIAYIGTQADKLPEAMSGILDLLNNMPESENTFSSLKTSLLQRIETSRTTGANVLFSYLSAQKLGLDYDITKDIYEKVPSLTLSDIKQFQEKYVKGRNYTILILGDKNKLDINTLEKYGKVQFLTLDEIFGY